MHARFCSYLLMLLLLLCGGYRSSALIISPTYIDGAGQTWDSTQKDVIDDAINKWADSVLDNRIVDIDFTFESAGSGEYLGQWSGNYSLASGTDIYPWTGGVNHTIKFNTDQEISFDTAEVPDSKYDALSITLHEIGHALGFASGFYFDEFYTGSQTDKWESHINASNVFDAGGLNVQMEGETHIANGEDLMATSIANGERKSISQTDLDMLELAYGYNIIPEPSVLLLIALALPLLMYKKLKNGNRS